MFNILNKKVIITGGARGIGLSLAKAFHEAGAEIAIIDISDEVYNVSEEIKTSEAKIHAIKGDLLNLEQVSTCFQEALEKLGGKIDVLINNAGIIKRGNSIEFPMETWNNIINLNVTSVFELSRLAAKEMIKQKSGKIINFGSIVSVIGGFESAAYSASKGAILQLTKTLSNEWAQHGIQVNAIAPGYILTDMNSDVLEDPERRKMFDMRIPAKRWGTPEDLVGTTLFLASPASDYVSGILIPVDGGVLGR